MSPKSVVQALEVALPDDNNIYVEITPAVNTSEPKQLGAVRGGQSQTIIIRPVE